MPDNKPRRPTIINGKYAHTSASQVNDWKRCPRIWYNKKVLKIDVPSTPAQERGTRIHAAIEHFLKTREYAGGAFDEYVYVAQPSLPKTGYFAESEVLLNTFIHGPLYVGYIDAYEPGRILDYKSTSDFRYCKSPEELEADTQLGAYAKWYFSRNKGESSVEVAHLYLLTKGKTPKANYVSGTMTPEKAEFVWQRDLKYVREITEIVKELVPAQGPIPDRSEELTPNLASCDMYGGCFFRSKCGLGKTLSKYSQKPTGQIFQIDVHRRPEEKKEMGMTLAEKLAAKAAANRAAESNPEVIANRAAEELNKRVEDAPERFESKDKPGDKEKLVEQYQKIDQEILNQLNDEEPMGVSPPDAPKQEAPKVEPEKPKRGRPKKEEKQEAPAEESKTDTGVIITKTDALNRREFRLFIDTFPIKGPSKSDYVLFEDWIVPFAQKVADDHGQPDWRYISYTAKAALVREIKNNLDKLPSAMVVMSYAPGSDCMMEVGIPLATEVLRGK
jgi:PD-(D/E)XK nuclease superfamily protein